MSGFFRFPHTPHLAWLGEGSARDDKVMSPGERDAFLSHALVAEEKIDGANLGLSFDGDGRLRAQNRGAYLVEPFTGQFRGLARWRALHEDRLFDLLGERLILFGEWMAARHSLGYTALPDWLVGFDLYDRELGQFWSTRRRDAGLHRAGVVSVARIFEGRTILADLEERLAGTVSRYRDGKIEGLYLRVENSDWLLERAKLVQPHFIQNIGEHWRRRGIQWNRLKHQAFVNP